MNSQETVPNLLPEWARDHAVAVRATLLNLSDPYPCHFAGQAERRNANAYGYLDMREELPTELRRVSDDLARYLAERATSSSSYRRATYLCAVGPPSSTGSLEQDRRRFWQVLGALTRTDVRPWPPSVPLDPEDPDWVFCFGGEPLFVFALSPHYGARRSRRVGSTLTICFQSASVFDGISGSTDAGRRAKALVRQALARYEEAPLIAALGDGLSSTQDKWRQYFPRDDGLSTDERCPFVHP